MLQARATRVVLWTQPIIIVHRTLIVASRTSHCARKHHLYKTHVRACKTYIVSDLCACIITLELAKLSTSLSRYPSRGKSTGSNAPRFDTAGSGSGSDGGGKVALGGELKPSFIFLHAGRCRSQKEADLKVNLAWNSVVRRDAEPLTAAAREAASPGGPSARRGCWDTVTRPFAYSYAS